MKNVKMTRNGDKLTIELDLTQDFGPSKSGKTVVVATTEGNQDVPGLLGAKIGINVYKPKQA